MNEAYEWIAALSAVYGMIFFYAVFHYVAMGFSLFRMMRSAGMTNAWMAWVPYCNTYALGDTADRYNLLCEGKPTAYGKKLLTWHVVSTVMSYPVVILLGALDPTAELADVTLGFWLLILAYAAFLIVYTVFYCISLHKIYKLFAPNAAAGLTVLSILIPVAVPVIFLAISKREARFPFAEETREVPADADTEYDFI